MSQIDITKPRRRYSSDDCSLEFCPECGAKMVVQDFPMILSVKSSTDRAEIIANLSGSHFCEKCPVVVFDSVKVKQAAILGIKSNKDIYFSIIGFVNMDAIPKEKRHLELGTDENPIPIIKFLPDLKPEPIISGKVPARNEPCSCGSGLKYKKCCGKG